MRKTNDERIAAMELKLGIQTPEERRQATIARMMTLWHVAPDDLAAVASVEKIVDQAMLEESKNV